MCPSGPNVWLTKEVLAKLAISLAPRFSISTETQEETDYFWNQLTSGGGQESQCAWLKDKFGLSWQVVPTVLSKLLADPDKRKAQRVMQAMLQMKKIDIAALERAAS